MHAHACMSQTSHVVCMYYMHFAWPHVACMCVTCTLHANANFCMHCIIYNHFVWVIAINAFGCDTYNYVIEIYPCNYILWVILRIASRRFLNEVWIVQCDQLLSVNSQSEESSNQQFALQDLWKHQYNWNVPQCYTIQYRQMHKGSWLHAWFYLFII